MRIHNFGVYVYHADLLSSEGQRALLADAEKAKGVRRWIDVSPLITRPPGTSFADDPLMTLGTVARIGTADVPIWTWVRQIVRSYWR